MAPGRTLHELPEELCRLMLSTAITKSWPGGWSVYRLLNRRAHRLFREVAADLPQSLSWLLPHHDPLHVHPPLASMWPGQVLVHLHGVGLNDDRMLCLLLAMHTATHEIV